MSIPMSAVILPKDARAGSGTKDTKSAFDSFFLKTNRRIKMLARANFQKELGKNPEAEQYR